MRIDPDMLGELLSTADPKATITLTATASVEEWQRLLNRRSGGKRYLSTREASDELGWKDSDWRRWAPELPGARREGKRWRIPREAAERKVDELMGRGRATTTTQKRRGGNHGRFWGKKAETAPAEGARAATIPIAQRLHRG